MPAAIIFLNGASGVGKTTIASEISRQDEILWIHPDGLWDTPNMDQRELTFRCVESAMAEESRSVLIDSQLRHSFMLDALGEFKVVGFQILLHCNEVVRRSRLLERGWKGSMIEAMVPWAAYLFAEAEQYHVPIVET